MRIAKLLTRNSRSLLLLVQWFFAAAILSACSGGGGGDDAPVTNTAPTISGTPVTSVAQDTAYSFTATATDSDGNTLLFSMTGNPAWLSIDPATGTVSGTPGNADVGTTTGIVITVNDQQGAANSTASLAPFDLTVTNVNDAPTISGTPATVVAQNAAYSFTPTAADIDGDTLLFTISGNPAWLGINPATGEVSGTPTNADVGTSNGIVVTVDDQQGEANSTASLAPFDLTVTNVNDAPTISGTPATSVAQNSVYSFTPTAGDIDGDTLLFTISGNPAWLTINSVTGEVSGTPTQADIGTTNGIVITVNDQQGAPNSTASLAAFDLTVTDVNDAPTISATPQTQVSAVDDAATAVLVNGDTYTYSFTPTANDVDGDTLLFTIANNPAWMSIDSATGEVSGTPETSDAGSYPNIIVTVDDQQGQPNSTTNLPAFAVDVVAGFNEALYADPSASAMSTPQRLYEANDGSLDAGNGWTAGAPPVAWIQFDFDSVKTLYKVTLVDLPALGTQFLTGEIVFSDGTTIPINTALPNDGTPQEFVFDPINTTSLRITVNTATGNAVLTEVMAYSALDPGQTELASDLFNDGDATGWTVVDNCLSGTSAWDANYKFYGFADVRPSYRQTGDCRGFTPNGVEDGTHSLLTGTSHTDADLRLMLRSDNDGVSNWVNGVMGVLFAYQDNDNYYRFDTNERNGYRRLWKKQGGSFTELAHSPQSYVPGDRPATYSQIAWVNLRVVLRNGVIVVYMDGEKVLTAEDSSFTDGKIALICARNQNCTFDNVVLLSGPSDPILGLNVPDGPGHVSGEYFVSTDSTLDVAAAVTETTGFDSVEFVVDEGQAGEISLIDATAPYARAFNLLPAGDHTVTAYLLDGVGARIDTPRATDTMEQVAASGIYLDALGDSITAGTNDDVPGDDISLDGRNTGGGYTTILNDLLTPDNNQSVTVLNNGNPGETSAEAVARLASVLAATPEAQGYLLLYGANDSAGGAMVPSGAGLTCTDLAAFTGCQAGYLGSFKHNMQQLINGITAEAKQVWLAKPLPHTANAGRDALQAEYGTVIQELVDEPFNGYAGYTPPDFYAIFSFDAPTYSLMADDQHPNGIGYQAMADAWCTAVNGQQSLLCTP